MAPERPFQAALLMTQLAFYFLQFVPLFPFSFQRAVILNVLMAENVSDLTSVAARKAGLEQDASQQVRNLLDYSSCLRRIARLEPLF